MKWRHGWWLLISWIDSSIKEQTHVDFDFSSTCTSFQPFRNSWEPSTNLNHLIRLLVFEASLLLMFVENLGQPRPVVCVLNGLTSISIIFHHVSPLNMGISGALFDKKCPRTATRLTLAPGKRLLRSFLDAWLSPQWNCTGNQAYSYLNLGYP